MINKFHCCHCLCNLTDVLCSLLNSEKLKLQVGIAVKRVGIPEIHYGLQWMPGGDGAVLAHIAEALNHEETPWALLSVLLIIKGIVETQFSSLILTEFFSLWNCENLRGR